MKQDWSQLDKTNLLDDWLLDYSIFSLKHTVWSNRLELWRKFLRSN